MSLTNAQRAQTSQELKENYRIAGLAAEKVAADLKFSQQELEDALNVGPASDGETVWRLRDYLEDRIKEQGKTPHLYSVLRTNLYYRYK